jgi:POT family proton-dependent oligopeptide transporter
MGKTTHSYGIILVSSVRLLERLSYYGMRSLLVLYLVRELDVSKADASRLYGNFTLIVGLLPLLGGILGDFVLGTRRSAILGLTLEAAGFFTLLIPGLDALKVALLLVALGTGIYSPNAIAQIGILYHQKKSLADSAVLIFYSAINMGAFLGTVIISIAGEDYNYQLGFALAGSAALASLGIQLLSTVLKKELPSKSNFIAGPEAKSPSINNVLGMLSVFIVIPIFWMIYEHSSAALFDINTTIPGSSGFRFSEFSLLNPIFTFAMGILFAILWTYAKVSSYLKVAIGFLVFFLAMLIIDFTSDLGGRSPSLAILFIAIIFFQALGEILIAPIGLALGLRYFPAKLMSSLIALYLIIATLFTHAISFISSIPEINLNISMGVCYASAIVCVVLFLILFFASRKSDESELMAEELT